MKDNKLIAEFMGFKILRSYPDQNEVCYEINGFCTKTTDVGSYIVENTKILLTETKFHSSWDWLMQVVQKMWKVTGHRCLFYQDVGDDTTLYGEGNSNIEEVYNLVVNFIHWYNK